MDDRFDPSDAATWIARGRSPEYAEALAQAWRDFPDLPPTAALEDRMARTRARVIAMRPVNDAIQLASEAERQRRNFLHVEGKAASGSIGDSDLAILRGRDAYGYDWDTAVCYSRGWYAAHAGWTHGGPDISSRLPAQRAAYDRGFTDGGGDKDDLFDAARRHNVAAERTDNQPRPLAPLQIPIVAVLRPPPVDNAYAGGAADLEVHAEMAVVGIALIHRAMQAHKLALIGRG